jgi:hypothetical protein
VGEQAVAEAAGEHLLAGAEGAQGLAAVLGQGVCDGRNKPVLLLWEKSCVQPSKYSPKRWPGGQSSKRALRVR